MEDDIDIYADLPNINLNLDKNDELCNCEKLKKELSSLQNKLEDIQKLKDNLEKNLSSLLKTARGEIARKDKMINDLRKRLDDTTFRRNNRGESRNFSTHKSLHQQDTVIEKYESAPVVHSQETETVLHKTEFHRNEDKSTKPQYEIQLPTVFAERLHKRIIKDEDMKKEDMKQKTSLKLVIEANLKDVPEENIVESDKENGSQSNMNNDGSESNTITQHSDSETPYRKNSGKRMNEEDSTRGNKRLKVDDSKGKTDETNYDCTVQYEMKDNLAQYEVKDNLAKFEDRLDVAHHLKEEEVSLDKRRVASEHQDTAKYNRDCTNGWKREERSNSRSASTSNHVQEEPNNVYKKDGYRYNSRRRGYSRSKSDYENSSGHRLRERSNRTYRNRKYDDYKYDSQYRTKRDYRLKRDYESMEGESKTRHRSRERGDPAWDKSRHTSSDIEDKEGSSTSSYKSKRYESRRIKETAANILHNKGLHERDKAEMDFRPSSSRTIVNATLNQNAKKTAEQDKVKNESNIKSINSTKDTPTKSSNCLEEGEIVDSPEKKMDSAKISKDHKLVKSDTKIEDKNEDVPTIASIINDKSIPLQNDVITGNQSDKVADIGAKEVKAVLCPVQTTLKDPEEVVESNSPGKNNAVVDETRKCNKVEDTYKSQNNEDLINSIICTTVTLEQVCEVQCNENLTVDSTTDTDIEPIKQVCDTNVEDEDVKSRVEEESKTSSVETATKIEGMADSNTEVKRIEDPDVESAINKDKVSESKNFDSPVTIIEANNSDNTRKIDEESKGSEAALNCDIEKGDENQVPIKSETSPRTSGNSNVEGNHSCLSDHNYVQDAPVDAVQESGPCETAPEEAATLKETKVEEKIEISSTSGMKRTTSSTAKNKKNQPSKGMVIVRRRRAVTLSDSNASMTVLMNTDKTSSAAVTSSNSSNEPFLKPRACKAVRACK